MFHHILRVRPMMTIGAVMALSTGIVACDAPDASDAPETEVSGDQASAEQIRNEPPGLPSFHVAPHARNAKSPEAKARLASGYHYAQGQFDEATYYGIYTYIDARWTYASMSIWGNDSSSMSSGMDVSAEGETWLQTGSYFIDEEGVARGDYATTFIDKDGAGTLYLTDFESSADSASYRSTIDHSNSKASPDCLYDSIWENSASESTQECTREDGKKWSCHYTYTYTPHEDGFGQVVSVEYRSEQQCVDERFPERAPAYHYEDVMTWDYVTGDYSDQASLRCYEDDGTYRQFSYSYSGGVSTWFDENGAEAPLGPTCGWNVGEAI